MPLNERPIPMPRTKDEYRQGVRLAVDNAERHLRCAELLAQADEWGPAVSHLVLAIEEAVKADVLADKTAKGAKSTYTDEKVAQLLRSHNPRHPIALAMSLPPPPWWADLVLAFVLGLIYLGTPEDARPSLDAIQAYQLDAAADRKAILPHDWADHAKKWRELGMYASFTLSGWESPADVTNREYMTLLRPAKKLVLQARGKLWPLQPRAFTLARPFIPAPYRRPPSSLSSLTPRPSRAHANCDDEDE
jgi:AbiV family abortive infection protein